MVGLGKWIRATDDIQRDTHLVHCVLFLHPNLGKLLFLLDTPILAFKLVVSISRLASQEYRYWPVVWPVHASD